MPLTPLSQPRALARASGLAYLAIIALGIFAQMAVRGSLVDGSSASATAAAILEHSQLYRLGLVADLAVFVLDAVLAVTFYRLLAPAGQTLALLALSVRLVMTAVMCANLLNLVVPLLILGDTPLVPLPDASDAEALSLAFLRLHGSGYILGLTLFGLHLLCLGVLLVRASWFPTWLGGLMGLSGLSYLALGLIHFGWPAANAIGGLLLIPAALPEFVFTGWLLVVGLNRERWMAAVR